MTATATTAATQPPWVTYTLAGRDGAPYEFEGRKIGSGTSWHQNKPRWFEVDIYDMRDGGFVVHTRGRSEDPREQTLARVRRTESAYSVVEMLTVKRCVVDRSHTCSTPGHTSELYLPRQSSHALAQAAKWNVDIRDAYVNRAVL